MFYFYFYLFHLLLLVTFADFFFAPNWQHLKGFFLQLVGAAAVAVADFK